MKKADNEICTNTHEHTKETKRKALQNAIIIIIFHMGHPVLKEIHIWLK